VVGNGRQLLMPGLVDAYSHGRALSPIQTGVLNDYLENNLLDWAFMPRSTTWSSTRGPAAEKAIRT